jgi:hypothetical protein
MNFDGFGGLALAVVAGLWLTVLVPSWFKRSQERERGVQSAPRKKQAKPVRVAKRPSIDNFAALARDYAESVEESAIADPRGWERNQLPEPRANLGTLEVAEIAPVASIESARQVAENRKLEQSELDEILRRRRAHG